MADPIQFVDDDPVAAQTQAIADYEAIAGRSLGNADPERLVISAFALRLAQVYSQINATGNQNLVRFATGVALEEIGYKFGIFRLPAASALVTLQFTINTTGAVTIPAGTRVKSGDGAVLFATDAIYVAAAGTSPRTVEVNATCLTEGLAGNGYVAGMINSIVDPIAYVTAAVNADTSTGGSAVETDDQLRARIPIANATFSVAGPHDAYVYFAKTADAGIVDVNVTTPVPGTVAIYPLLDGGVVPGGAVLDAVLAICSDKKVRPLTDTVTVLAPTEVTFGITANLTLKSNAMPGTAAAVAAALNAFVNQWKTGLGRLGVDVVVDQLTAVAMLAGVYSVDFPTVPVDISIADNEFAKCTSVLAHVVGVADEV